MLDKNKINEIRGDFKYLTMGNNYVYFDNAATTQKPKVVIDAIEQYYSYENGNPHRGAHYFANKSTEVYENAREKVRAFINAKSSKEVVFVRNATEAINLVAYSWALENLKAGDEILISIMEHHSNLVTWQYVARRTGAKLVYLYIDNNMQISEDEFEEKINENTKLLAITAASNVVGTSPNVKLFIERARKVSPSIICLVDAAQYMAHEKVDVVNMDCDFLVFSGHKMYAAMGIGVLYGKEKLLNNMSPYMYGGEMIEYVGEQYCTYAQSPMHFEAGTVNVGGAKSLSIAIDYINSIGIEEIGNYERLLYNFAYEKMKKLPYLEIYCTKNENRSPLIAFNFKGVHPHDVATILESYNIAIRSGHHCAQPLHHYLGINSSCRASFSFYNTFEEIDYFIEHLESVKEMMHIGS